MSRVVHGWSIQEMGFRHSCIQGRRQLLLSPCLSLCSPHSQQDFLPEPSPCSSAVLTFPSLARKKELPAAPSVSPPTQPWWLT